MKKDTEAAEVGAIEHAVEAFDPDPYYARGDLRDVMLEVVRSTADWTKLGEQRQRDINAALDNAAVAIIDKLVTGLRAEGKQAVHATLESMTIKGGIKLSLKADHSHLALMLGDATGKQVLVTVAEGGDFGNARGEARVDVDQPELPEQDDLADALDEVAEQEKA